MWCGKADKLYLCVQIVVHHETEQNTKWQLTEDGLEWFNVY